MARSGGVGIFQRERAFAGYQIGRSIPCRNCKYDLRGLSYAHQCPECGKSVAATLDRLLQGEATESKVANLRQGLRMTSASWMVYLALVIACLSPVFALLLIAIGPVMRLCAIPSLAKAKDDLPTEWSLPLPLLAMMACGTLATTALYMVALLVMPGLGSILAATLFLIMLGTEGFTWMTTLAKYAHQLEFPVVGPLTRLARWSWLPVIALTVLLLVTSEVSNVVQTFDLGQFFFVIGIGFCALITSGVTVTFSDIVRQLAITGELDTSVDPILVLVGTPPVQTTDTDTSPLDVATSSGEQIHVNESTVKLRDPQDKPRDQRNDPNNPTGVY